MRKILSIIIILSFQLSCIAQNPIAVYFTSPGKKIGRNNPQRALVRLIHKTKKTFYGAFYDISSIQISEELIRAHKRGVDVRLVTEKSNFSGKAILSLIREGIPIVTDNRSGLMHNKFAISDHKYVFTGSYNLTDNGTGKNNNNAIIIKSTGLAEIFFQEFQEMFGSKIFGNKKERGLFSQLNKKYYVKLKNTNINAYFSPDDDVEKIILRRIRKARKSIRFMYFSFTSGKVADEIISKHKSGIKIMGLMEKRGSFSKYSQFVKMNLEGIPVKRDKNRYIMHHKVIIIDDYRVITGSYNMSKNASKRNDENIVIIDNPQVAAKFIREFRRLYDKK